MPNRSLALLLAPALLLSIAGCSKTVHPKPTHGPQPLVNDSSMQVGGENVVTLRRTRTPDTTQPQFVSATIFPGRGFNVFQITADVPGQGVINLLASPSVEQAASVLTGGPDDQFGVKSFSFGGAFLIPYPNRIVGKLSPDGKTVTAEWHGHTLTLPADWQGKKPGAKKVTMHGLILADKVGDIQKTTTANGQTVTGVLHAGNFDGYWLSKTDLKFEIALEGSSFTATVTATNVGNEAEPMSIGWHPYFAIPSHHREQARVYIPATERTLVNNYDDVFPTGKLQKVAGSKYDFDVPGGKPLDHMFLDDNFSSLKRDNGVVDVKLIDPQDHYGLNIEGLSPEISTVQIYSPPTAEFTAIEQQFNFNDPLGSEWHGMKTGMVTLEPGKSVTWKVRLQLFVPPPTSGTDSATK